MDILKLTKSKARERILRLFFSDTNRKYYLRELERILNIAVGNIRRELLLLEKSGIFSHEKAGNQVYYFLNKNSSIFEEFKKIVSKTIGAEGLLRQKLSEIKNIQSAFIFGSFAKNREDSFSDIDLMIIGNPDENKLISAVSSLEEELKKEINYNIFSIKDIKDGLKKKEVFLEEIMANPKIFIIGNQNDLEKIIGRQ